MQPKGAGFAEDISFLRAFVGGFHEARTAAGNDVASQVRQLRGEILGRVEQRIAARNPAAAENRYAKPAGMRREEPLQIIDNIPELQDDPVDFRIPITTSALRHLR